MTQHFRILRGGANDNGSDNHITPRNLIIHPHKRDAQIVIHCKKDFPIFFYKIFQASRGGKSLCDLIKIFFVFVCHKYVLLYG